MACSKGTLGVFGVESTTVRSGNKHGVSGMRGFVVVERRALAQRLFDDYTTPDSQPPPPLHEYIGGNRAMRLFGDVDLVLEVTQSVEQAEEDVKRFCECLVDSYIDYMESRTESIGFHGRIRRNQCILRVLDASGVYDRDESKRKFSKHVVVDGPVYYSSLEQIRDTVTRACDVFWGGVHTSADVVVRNTARLTREAVDLQPYTSGMLRIACCGRPGSKRMFKLRSCLMAPDDKWEWEEKDTFPTCAEAVLNTLASPPDAASVASRTLPSSCYLSCDRRLPSNQRELDYTNLAPEIVEANGPGLYRIVQICLRAFTEHCPAWRKWADERERAGSPLIKEVVLEPAATQGMVHPVLGNTWFVDTHCSWCPERGSEHNGGARCVALRFNLGSSPVKVHACCQNGKCRADVAARFKRLRRGGNASGGGHAASTDYRWCALDCESNVEIADLVYDILCSSFA